MRLKSRRGIYFVKYWPLYGGPRRTIKLFQVWHNICNRVHGRVKDGSGRAIWHGLEVGFSSFAEFREWAIASGFGKEGRVSPDRIKSDQGYVPGNIQWLTKEQNKKKARNSHKASCKCFYCKAKQAKE